MRNCLKKALSCLLVPALVWITIPPSAIATSQIISSSLSDLSSAQKVHFTRSIHYLTTAISDVHLTGEPLDLRQAELSVNSLVSMGESDAEMTFAAAHFLQSLRSPDGHLSKIIANLRPIEVEGRKHSPEQVAGGLRTVVGRLRAVPGISELSETALREHFPGICDGSMQAAPAVNTAASSGPDGNPALRLSLQKPSRAASSISSIPKFIRWYTGTDSVSLRIWLGGVFGNVFEWLEFALCGYLVQSVAPEFFPKSDPIAAMISTLGIYALGFVMRPIGAAVLGRLGDIKGRKFALTLSLGCMALATTLTGLTPTYATVGILAPILLTLFRMVQGFSAGAELATSITLMAEHAPAEKRGHISSFTFFGATIGLALGSLIGTLIVPHATFLILGWRIAEWRIPFLCGLAVGAIGIYIRLRVPETEAFLKKQRTTKSPLLDLFKKGNLKNAVLAFGSSIVGGGAMFLLFMFMPTYLEKFFHVAHHLAFGINTACMGVAALLTPLMGALSDKIGRKPVLLFAAGGLLVSVVPLFMLLGPTFWPILTAQLCFAVFVAAWMGALPAALAELFPTGGRSSSVGVSQNLATAIFAGTIQVYALTLIALTHSLLAPAWCLFVYALLSVIAILFLPKGRHGKQLE